MSILYDDTNMQQNLETLHMIVDGNDACFKIDRLINLSHLNLSDSIGLSRPGVSHISGLRNLKTLNLAHKLFNNYW